MHVSRADNAHLDVKHSRTFGCRKPIFWENNIRQRFLTLITLKVCVYTI